MEPADSRGQTAAAADTADTMIWLAWVGLVLADPNLPPPVRPEGFWGAIGVPFPQAHGKVTLSLRAEPTHLAVGESLTLTLTVRGTINPTALERPDLRGLEAFRTRFAIDDLPDPAAEAETDRVFAWRLRPRSTEVSAIPPLDYVYWRSGAQPPSRGFQTTDTGPAIHLDIVPPEPPPPETFIELTDDRAPTFWYDLAAIALGLLPLVIEDVVGPWRRRSRAAPRALARAATHPAWAIRGYLEERLDVPVGVWVPSEFVPGLSTVGVPMALAERTAALIERTDVARFGAGPEIDAAEVRSLINDLEAWACSRHSA